ncbi:MAG TPA: hypothetical protein VK790_00725 [Solirubrobacteraceae bacterium]|nr:hypothetical protein [Solirubrobacteraceae bacterium]
MPPVPVLGTIARALVVLCALCALAAAPASARESTAARAQNAAATHAYLLATVSLQEAEVRNLAQSKAAIEAAAARVAGECPGILAGAPPAERELGIIGPRSQTPVSPRAMGEEHRESTQRSALKLELSLTLGDAQTEPDREAIAALPRALQPLRWSNPYVNALMHLIAAIAQTELELPMPNPCADMRAWVSSGYKTLNTTSKEISSRSEATLKDLFEAIAIAEQGHLKSQSDLLASYEDATDKALARHSHTLNVELHSLNVTRAAALKQLEAAVGLPAPKPIKRLIHKENKPTVVARGITAAGGRFVVRAARQPRPPSERSFACTVSITIEEPARPAAGLLEVLKGEGAGRCLSRSHVEPEPAVHCDSGLLVIEANLPAAVHSVRLLLSNQRTITSPAIRIPARLGGPVGLYYQAVRGPSPIPVSLTELGPQGETLAVVKLPPVVECTKNPKKFLRDGIVRLIHEAAPQAPAFTIRAESYRELGVPYFELSLEREGEGETLFGENGANAIEQALEQPPGLRGRLPVFKAQAAAGCKPQPYVILYGLLRAPRDTVLALVSGKLVPLRTVAIPAHLHAHGMLAYGVFSPLPTEVVIHNARGATVASESLSQAAAEATETCEGEAEG